MKKGPIFALAMAALGTAAGACAIVGDDGSESSENGVTVDVGAGRVCPSKQLPDGGWVVVDGMDVSDYQFTKWDEVAAKNPALGFGIVRISAGLVRVDTRFTYDWPEMKRVGLVRGAYQYFKPSQSAIAQVDLALKRLKEEGGLERTDLPPVLDFETTNDMPPETVTCRVKLWLARIERATKRIPIIYSSHLYKQFLTREFSRYPLWIANYVKTPSKTCPMTPDTWGRWTMWQHSDQGIVRGVYDNGDRNGPDGGYQGTNDEDGGDGGPKYSGSDVNYFNGTMAELKSLVANTVSHGDVADPPRPVPLPKVPGAATQPGGPVDCADGCCEAVPALTKE